MANSRGLEALLAAPTEITGEVYISRLKAKFTVKSLTNAEIDQARMQATVGRDGKLDDERYGALVIAAGTVDPDFSDAALRKKFNAIDNADCVHKALLPGECAKLTNKILELSGFNDEEETLEEVKN